MGRDVVQRGVPAVNLVVAIQVHQFEVGVAVVSALAARLDVMLMELFSVDEGVTAYATDIALRRGQLSATGRQGLGLLRFARRPVVPQPGVVG